MDQSKDDPLNSVKVRITEEGSRQLFAAAEELGITPSELLRQQLLLVVPAVAVQQRMSGTPVTIEISGVWILENLADGDQ